MKKKDKVSRHQKIRERGDHEKEIRVREQKIEGRILCPTKKWAVDWIQSFLEQVYRKRGVRAYPGEKSQLEPSRDRENMRRDREDPIPDVMKEDQWPTE
jgi:hypothetical protein